MAGETDAVSAEVEEVSAGGPAERDEYPEDEDRGERRSEGRESQRGLRVDAGRSPDHPPADRQRERRQHDQRDDAGGHQRGRRPSERPSASERPHDADADEVGRFDGCECNPERGAERPASQAVERDRTEGHQRRRPDRQDERERGDGTVPEGHEGISGRF